MSSHPSVLMSSCPEHQAFGETTPPPTAMALNQALCASPAWTPVSCTKPLFHPHPQEMGNWDPGGHPGSHRHIRRSWKLTLDHSCPGPDSLRAWAGWAGSAADSPATPQLPAQAPFVFLPLLQEAFCWETNKATQALASLGGRAACWGRGSSQGLPSPSALHQQPSSPVSLPHSFVQMKEFGGIKKI